MGHQTKRDLLVALALGCLMEFSIWYPVYSSATAGEYPLLENLQEPGVRVAYFVAGIIWKFVEPHRSAYPTHTVLSVFAYLASTIRFPVSDSHVECYNSCVALVR